ncbi:hypothetical protein [Alienimonas californiensis]|uniref:Uncharacterized protein n=1 Tax=Alienimonas californiensis TaxID=2527989 RepID=A0A517P4W4_9PLAN|nr:hypothetical protein [Alienimonas californiensis]QDT14420.1 hypothetical protein CA12_04930 [Alienimonas californiensis]
MALNEELSWTDVGAISTGGGGHVRDAFQTAFGDPTKELLPAGMSIYKFNAFSSLAPPPVTDDSPLSPWWSPTQPFKHDAGYAQRLSIAEANGVSMREWGRLTSCIKENWSSLDFLLTVELKVPVYAWFGGFKGMARLDPGETSRRNAKLEARGRSTGLPGGGTQFYIPNLTVGHVRNPSFEPL